MKERIEFVAMICHEANRAYCVSIGDNSQPSWREAPEWQRSSAINGVKFHIAGLASGVPHPPSASHESWMKQKLDEGWEYGPTKNPEAKQHPCIVPYEELPAEQKFKDSLFSFIVEAFWESVEAMG